MFFFCFSVVEEHATVEAVAPENIITQEADDVQGETTSPEQHQPDDVGEFQEFAGAEPSVEKEEQQQQPEEIITSKSKSESLLEESAPVSAGFSVESNEEEGCEKESERRWSNPFEAPVVDQADVDRDDTDDALKTEEGEAEEKHDDEDDHHSTAIKAVFSSSPISRAQDSSCSLPEVNEWTIF